MNLNRKLWLLIISLTLILVSFVAFLSCGQQQETATTTSTSTTISSVETTGSTTTITVSTTSTTTTTNPAPTISAINFSKLSIGTLETVTITCVATDEQGEPLIYSWRASSGNLSATTGMSINWTAPSEVNDYLITVEVSDGINPVVTGVATAHVETDVAADDTPRLVYYMAQGMKIGGVMQRSSGTNLPVFIYTHGGSNPADLTGNAYTYAGDCIPSNVRTLYGGPCVVLAAGNYGDQPFQSGISLTDELKRNFYKDILVAVEFVKRKDYVDKTKIALFGESRGGYNMVRLLENSSDIKVAAAWAVPVTKSWCSPLLTEEVTKISTPLLNLHHISDETVSITDGRLIRDRFYAVFGSGTTQYAYEELSHGGITYAHPGPYDDTFKTTTPWMTKTFQYFSTKGL